MGKIARRVGQAGTGGAPADGGGNRKPPGMVASAGAAGWMSGDRVVSADRTPLSFDESLPPQMQLPAAHRNEEQNMFAVWSSPQRSGTKSRKCVGALRPANRFATRTGRSRHESRQVSRIRRPADASATMARPVRRARSSVNFASHRDRERRLDAHRAPDGARFAPPHGRRDRLVRHFRRRPTRTRAIGQRRHCRLPITTTAGGIGGG